MSYPEDFVDACRRHQEDADLLFKHHRWANADQLYGLTAECGLKARMVKWGVLLDNTGEVKGKYRVHVHKLWRLFEDCAKGRGETRELGFLPRGTPFADWSPDERYAHRRHFDEAGVTKHRKAAEDILRLVELEKQDNG